MDPEFNEFDAYQKACLFVVLRTIPPVEYLEIMGGMVEVDEKGFVSAIRMPDHPTAIVAKNDEKQMELKTKQDPTRTTGSQTSPSNDTPPMGSNSVSSREWDYT